MPLLEKLAVEYDVDARNQVKLPGQCVFLCILNGLLNHPELSQRMLEEQYKKITSRFCDHSSFGRRLSSISTHYFRAILAHLHSVVGLSISKGDIQALKLRICDATITTLSAKLLSFGIKANHGGKGEKSQVKSVIELSNEGIPDLLHICKDQSEFSDTRALGETMKSHTRPGDLWVFDKGCNGRQILLSLHSAGSFWITPHSTQGIGTLKKVYVQTKGTTPADIQEKPQSACLIDRVEQAIFSNSHRDNPAGLESMVIITIHCYRWDMRARCWKPFVLMTNLPLSECKTKAGPFSFEEITQIYRRRWEIETFFKLIKQHLGYEHLTSRTENGIAVMILMSMITALLMLWYKQQTRIKNGWKAVKFWLADDVRGWTSRSVHTMQVCQT